MDKEEVLAELQKLADRPGGRARLSLAVHLANIALPPLGGLIDAVGRKHEEEARRQWDRLVLEHLRSTACSLESLEAVLKEVTARPDMEGLTQLLTEVLGEDLAISFVHYLTGPISVLLNPSTVEELQAYARAGLLLIKPTGSQSSLGDGNRMGGHIEERKRPWGNGSGFRIALPPLSALASG